MEIGKWYLQLKNRIKQKKLLSDPIPTDHTATDPSPTDPIATDPTPTDPTPTDPTPTDPTPTDPTLTDPTATDATLTDPTPTDPTPTDPTLTDPTATDATATDPTPTDPSATDPTATDPTPTDPTATDATATDPTLTDPTPTDPTPTEPTPTISAPKAKAKECPQARMMQILHFEQDGDAVIPKLDFQTLKKIVSDDRCENLPFFVMSMTGCRRNGKSFLTNLLISKFEFQEKHWDDGLSWIDSDEVIEGVDWNRQRDSVTKGIWVWSRPIVVNTVGNQQVAVILLDCQGLYDPAPQQETMDAMITLYSLELSKLQIFNSKGDINASDLQHLESIISFAGVSGLSRMFNTLVLLHRDWDSDGEYGKKGCYFRNMQEERQLSKTEQVIKNAFVESAECTLPTPGANIRTGDVGKEESLQGFMKDDESATFLRYVDKFGNMILKDYVTQSRHLRSLDQLLITIERINEHIQDGEKHYSFHSPAELHERRQILEIYEHVEDEKLPAVAERIQAGNYGPNEKTKMEDDIAEEKNAVKAYLEQKKNDRPSPFELTQKTWREVDNRVDQWFEVLAKLRRLEFEGNLYKGKWENFTWWRNTAGKIALCVGTVAAATAMALANPK